MLKDFCLSFKIKMTYRANSIIYLLKHLPLIGRLFKNKLYSNQGLKIVAYIIGIQIELSTFFIGKLLYFIAVFLLLSCFPGDVTNISYGINYFFYLAIVGAVMYNKNMFEYDNDKNYAIGLLKFDAKRYYIANYSYYLFKTLVGGFIVSLLIGFFDIKYYLAIILLPFITIFFKTIYTAFSIYYFEKKKAIAFSSIISKSIFVIIIGCLSFLPCLFDVPIAKISIYISSILLFVLFSISCLYIFKYNNYMMIFKFTRDDNNVKLAKLKNYKDKNSYYKAVYTKQVSNKKVESDKKGYAYFNDLFIKRHRNTLHNSVIIYSLIIFVAYVIILYLIKFQNLNLSLESFKKLIPIFLFICYLLNTGRSITRAMFYNCDSSMLTYSFYRQPKAILSLFKERLVFLIKNNLCTAVLFCIGNCLILWALNETNIMSYVYYVLSLIFMSVFFSIHNLVIYYLLQPYTKDLEMKSPLLRIVDVVTYMACYMGLSIKVDLIPFSIIIISFTIVYSVVSLLLAYYKAPKTFKLRV